MRWTTVMIVSLALARAAAASAQTGPAFEDAHAELRTDASFQFEFDELPEPSQPPGWLEAVFGAIASFFQILQPVLTVVFWGGVVILVGAVLFYAGREAWRFARRGRAAAAASPAIYTPAPEVARALLAEADRLGAKGDFAAAVRVLLFRSIEDIQTYHPNALREAMTSREISVLPILQPAARAAFSEIAKVVERSHFAGRPVVADDFAACRTAYGVFAGAGRAA